MVDKSLVMLILEKFVRTLDEMIAYIFDDSEKK